MRVPDTMSGAVAMDQRSFYQRVMLDEAVFCTDIAAADKESAIRSMVRLILEGKGYTHDVVETAANRVLRGKGWAAPGLDQALLFPIRWRRSAAYTSAGSCVPQGSISGPWTAKIVICSYVCLVFGKHGMSICYSWNACQFFSNTRIFTTCPAKQRMLKT